MALLKDIPDEVLLDNLFPNLDLQALLALSSVNRALALLGSDELLWKRKLKDDFNFDGNVSARTSGWKFIYRGLTCIYFLSFKEYY